MDLSSGIAVATVVIIAVFGVFWLRRRPPLYDLTPVSEQWLAEQRGTPHGDR
jgi:hypothetical protein